MKTVDRRIRILEIRFGMTVVATGKVVPTAPEMIVERLVAGEWECVLRLLELPEQEPMAAVGVECAAGHNSEPHARY